MARKWKETIDLKDAWEDYACGTYEIEDMVEELLAQIRLCGEAFAGDVELEDLALEFERISLAPDPESVREKVFDQTMNKLYDWADKGRRLLILTA